MPKLVNFPTAKTTVGTLMGVGITPQREDGQTRIFGFALFDHCGALTAYKLRTEADYLYILEALRLRSHVFNGGNTALEREDLQVETSATFKTTEPNFTLYDVEGAAVAYFNPTVVTVAETPDNVIQLNITPPPQSAA